jgi:Starch-binding associating with outer membrane
MKRKIVAPFLMAALLVSAASCKKSFWTKDNINPQAPDSVSANLILPNVLSSMGYTQGGDMSRFTSLFTQQVVGANSQSQAYYEYIINSGVFENVWGDYYTSTLTNNDTLMHLADRKGLNMYSGVSRIFMAYCLQVGVDMWGDLPYSKAFQGDKDLKPSYDQAQGLYDTIASLVHVGIAYIGNPNHGVLAPGADDGLFHGDSASWVYFGHAILARLAIHQSKITPATAATALQEVALAFPSSNFNASYIFSSSETAANPWYQFEEQRNGDETFTDAPLITRMAANNDPRVNIFTDPNTDLGAFYGSANSPVEFITYDEMLYVAAEAELRNGGSYVASQAFLTQAITENMAKLGVAPADIATYLAAHGTMPTTSVDDAIAFIANEEFTALYLNPEAWAVWRRTGSPALSPTTGSEIPRRLLYPQSELSFNTANTPTGITLFSPTLFWDK